jgi:hypothetical protein
VTRKRRPWHRAGRCAAQDARDDRRDTGAVAVEFALVVPVLVLLLIGTVIAGSVFVNHLKLQAAAREGARAGALVPARACSTAMDGLQVSGASCRVESSCPGGSSAIRLQAVEVVTLPILGERTVTLQAGAKFSCLV